MKIFFLAVISVIFISLPARADENISDLRTAIKQYKSGNYTGSMQTLTTITANDPGNALAFYYLGMSYAQIGNSNSALTSYNNVILLAPKSRLATNARTGIINLEPPEPNTLQPVKNTTDFLADRVKETFQNSNINTVIKNTNINKKIDPKLYKRLENFDPDKKESDTFKYLNAQPTREQIVEALQVLSKVGVNPTNFQSVQSVQNFQNNPVASINPEMMQMNMLMSSFGGGNMNNGGMNGMNGMSGMMPILMMMQNNKGNNKMSPEILQSMVSNMMMQGMSDLYGNNNNNN